MVPTRPRVARRLGCDHGVDNQSTVMADGREVDIYSSGGFEGAMRAWASSEALRGCDVEFVAATEPATIDLEVGLRRALMEPCACPRLRDLARGRGDAVIIASDNTRPVPTRALLGPVVEELHAAGIPDTSILIVIATGAHRAMSEAELEHSIGADWLSRIRVISHDARNGEMVFVGETPRGNRIRLNRRVVEAGIRIALGVVEPHPFAGFSGGSKAVLPGIASYEAILHVHSVNILSHPQARAGVLDGNPVHEEILCAARFAPLEFIVNVVMNRDLRPVAVAAGDPELAHRELVKFILNHSRVSIHGPSPDVVVTGPDSPQDINLYQAMKALIAVEPVAGPDTSLLLVSACSEGSGSPLMVSAFSGADTAEDVLLGLQRNYAVENNGSLALAKVLTKCASVLACCPGVDDSELRTMLLEPVPTPIEGLAKVLQRVSHRTLRPHVVFVPSAQRLLLSLSRTCGSESRTLG
jgi:nickel-dependent lactate racemase